MYIFITLYVQLIKIDEDLLVLNTIKPSFITDNIIYK